MMATKQHIIAIHGRATKPSEMEKRRLVKTSILHGLDRVSGKKADKLRSGEVRLSLAYYGDINNAEMMKAGKKSRSDLTGRDPAHDNAPCEERK